MEPIIKLESITKDFGRVRANDSVDMELYPGEVVGLLGENGAGKTTLMNVLYGLVMPDEGQIKIKGENIDIGGHSPADSIRLGVSMVHQEFMLVNRLSVMENLIIGEEPTKHGLIDKGEAEGFVRRLSDKYELEVDPNDIVGDLSVSERQRLEILRALYHQAKVLILDEPTAVLAPSEVQSLFNIIRQLRDDGMCIVLIAHKLKEVLSICHRIYVLREGKIVGETTADETTQDKLAHLMVGEDYQRFSEEDRKKKVIKTNSPVLEVSEIWVSDTYGNWQVKGISLDVYPGEIVSIAGIAGNGQSQLEQALAGLLPIKKGQVFLDEKNVTNFSVLERKKGGLGYIPQDRHEYGLALSFSVKDNLILGRHRLSRFNRWGVMKYKKIEKAVNQEIKDFDIVCESMSVEARSLSGGNQQKVVLARAVADEPKVLLASQIGRGLDVSAIANIYRYLQKLCDEGKGILLVSFDLDEVFELSDRIYIMRGGEFVGELDNQNATRQKVGELMTGAE